MLVCVLVYSALVLQLAPLKFIGSALSTSALRHRAIYCVANHLKNSVYTAAPRSDLTIRRRQTELRYCAASQPRTTHTLISPLHSASTTVDSQSIHSHSILFQPSLLTPLTTLTPSLYHLNLHPSHPPLPSLTLRSLTFIMAFRSVIVSAVLAAIFTLFASVPVAGQITPPAPAQCTAIIGNSNLTQYQNTIELGSGNLIFGIGYFKAPLFTIYANYSFTFTVPDQTGYTTPNQLKFAVYTNNTKGSSKLVSQSQTVTIQSVSGPQTFTVGLQGSAGLIIPGQNYIIAIYNQFDTVYYYNTNAKQPSKGSAFVDVSAGFPSTLEIDFVSSNYLFPAVYYGCQCNNLLGDSNLADYPNTIELGSGNLIFAIGTFKAPSFTLYTNYEFVFSVPDQTGYATPNQLKFAVYTYNTTSPKLVTQSPVVTIQSISGQQNFTVPLKFNVTEILNPGKQYLLAVYNQFDTVYFFNQNAKVADVGEAFVDASGGFPQNLELDFTTSNYLYPLSYKGCDIAL